MSEYFWWVCSWWLVWNRDVDKEGWRHSFAYCVGQVVGLVFSLWWLWDIVIYVVR